MKMDQAKRLKELEKENVQLKVVQRIGAGHSAKHPTYCLKNVWGPPTDHG